MVEKLFMIENLLMKCYYFSHLREGLLLMVNYDKNTNVNQVFITLKYTLCLDEKMIFLNKLLME